MARKRSYEIWKPIRPTGPHGTVAFLDWEYLATETYIAEANKIVRKHWKSSWLPWRYKVAGRDRFEYDVVVQYGKIKKTYIWNNVDQRFAYVIPNPVEVLTPAFDPVWVYVLADANRIHVPR